MKLRNYALVTAGYWVFTLTDGALRMLVLLHFHDLGYSPVAIAFLFIAYELMGILTNLLGGWVGARRGLNRTLVAGLGLQVVALAALTLQAPSWQRWLSVTFVTAVQALSGIAKDLTKMSSKSAVKSVAGDGSLFRLVAVLTGSKNALKGVGFFLGAALLAWLGYDGALWTMAAALAVTMVALLVLLDEDIGRSKKKPPLRSLLSKSAALNRLSAARFFLFGRETSGSWWPCPCSSPTTWAGRTRVSAGSWRPGSSVTASSSRSPLACWPAAAVRWTRSPPRGGGVSCWPWWPWPSPCPRRWMWAGKWQWWAG